MSDRGSVLEGVHIEEQIARQIIGGEDVLALYGLAVAVERATPEAPGIAITHQLPQYPVLDTELSSTKPRKRAGGSVLAVDPENNALWLRPRRLSSVAIDCGFLIAAGFVQNGEPAYSVTIRVPTWRDGMPYNSRSFYGMGNVPTLQENAWARLNKAG